MKQTAPRKTTVYRYPYAATVAHVPEGYAGTSEYPRDVGDRVLILGEIGNAPGQVALATQDGRVHWAYHPQDFEAGEE